MWPGIDASFDRCNRHDWPPPNNCILFPARRISQTGTYNSAANEFFPPNCLDMVRKIIIMLCLCCVILCAFVGYLSKTAIEDSQVRQGPGVATSCGEILNQRPTSTARLLVTEFVPGKHFASLDFDNDGKWEQLCVPFFSPKFPAAKHSYRAVLICFRELPDREAFKAFVASGEIDADFWPLRQKLDVALHSQLAQQYKNMDFANSPVLYCGFESANPVLGETSLMISIGLGCLATLAAVLTLIVGLFMGMRRRVSKDPTELEPTTNRAGLPYESVLDRVHTMREKEPV